MGPRRGEGALEEDKGALEIPYVIMLSMFRCSLHVFIGFVSN